jgi:hypothetical protein
LTDRTRKKWGFEELFVWREVVVLRFVELLLLLELRELWVDKHQQHDSVKRSVIECLCCMKLDKSIEQSLNLSGS